MSWEALPTIEYLGHEDYSVPLVARVWDRIRIAVQIVLMSIFGLIIFLFVRWVAGLDGGGA